MIRILQHVAGEGPGLLASALAREGLAFTVIRVDRGEPVPRALEGASGLVLLGGPMAAYQADERPHLRDELCAVEAALRAGVPVLGICLGSQLVAAALGARVVPGPAREVGWLAVTPKPAAAADALFAPLPPRFVALCWHGDVFDLPAGATSLASSERTEHQAFRHGDRAYGILFHPEATPAIVRAMTEDSADELAGTGVTAEALLDEAEQRAEEGAALGVPLLQRWARLASRG